LGPQSLRRRLLRIGLEGIVVAVGVLLVALRLGHFGRYFGAGMGSRSGGLGRCNYSSFIQYTQEIDGDCVNNEIWVGDEEVSLD
jgi:hypothetical protein